MLQRIFFLLCLVAEEMGLVQSEHSLEVEQLSQQLQSTSIPVNEKGLSSLVWIATARPNKAVILVMQRSLWSTKDPHRLR